MRRSSIGTADAKTSISKRVLFRSAQSSASVLFVPLTTIAFITIPQRMNADAARCSPCFRNVAGSIGISLATAGLTERTQAHSAIGAQHVALNEQFNLAVSKSAVSHPRFRPVLGDPMQLDTARCTRRWCRSRDSGLHDGVRLLRHRRRYFDPICFLLSPVKSRR